MGVPMEVGVAGPSPGRCNTSVCRWETAGGGVGIANVGRRGRGQSLEMHYIKAPVGDVRRQHSRADGRRGGRDSLRRNAPIKCAGKRLQEEAWASRGKDRWQGTLLGDAPTVSGSKRRPEMTWVLPV